MADNAVQYGGTGAGGPQSGGGGWNMCWGGCCFNDYYSCCCYCGGNCYTGCNCLTQDYIDSGYDCYMGAGSGDPGNGDMCLDTGSEANGYVGSCELWCGGCSGQNMSGNTEGTPIDCQLCWGCNKVCNNRGAGQNSTQGGRSGQQSYGGSPGGGFGGGSGGSKPAQQPQNQNNNQINSLLNQLTKLGSNLLSATMRTAQTQNQAVVGKPGVQTASIAGSGDLLMIVLVGGLLVAMLFMERKEA